MDFNAMSALNRFLLAVTALFIITPLVLTLFGIFWNKQVRIWGQDRGRAVAPFRSIVSRFVVFSFKEETLALLPASKMADIPRFWRYFLQYRFLYLAAFIISILLFTFGGTDTWFWLPMTLALLTMLGRATAIFRARHRILVRMFNVANSEFKYGRGADLNPWGFVQVKKWDSLYRPGDTIVTYPESFRADMPASRESFERHFNGTVTDDNLWVYEWKNAQSIVHALPVSHITTLAPYPGASPEWNRFAVGVGLDGVITYDVTQQPHVLICGSTGAGKSVLQRQLIFHCIQHNDRWRFLGVDLKRVEFAPFAKYSQTVAGIGTTLEDGVEIIRYARDLMQQRFEEMEALGITNIMDRESPPHAFMLMIDETYMLLAPENVKTDEGKARDQLHGEAAILLGEIARLGRAAGVFLVMATQRPDAKVLSGEMKNNLDIRVAAGRLDSTPSLMVLDNAGATLLPGNIKGRGIIRRGGENEQFQGYFATPDWIDNWLLDHQDHEPKLFAEGGVLVPLLRKREEDQAAAALEASSAATEKAAKKSKKTGASEEEQAPEEGFFEDEVGDTPASRVVPAQKPREVKPRPAEAPTPEAEEEPAELPSDEPAPQIEPEEAEVVAEPAAAPAPKTAPSLPPRPPRPAHPEPASAAAEVDELEQWMDAAPATPKVLNPAPVLVPSAPSSSDTPAGGTEAVSAATPARRIARPPVARPAPTRPAAPPPEEPDEEDSMSDW